LAVVVLKKLFCSYWPAIENRGLSVVSKSAYE